VVVYFQGHPIGLLYPCWILRTRWIKWYLMFLPGVLWIKGYMFPGPAFGVSPLYYLHFNSIAMNQLRPVDSIL
jgi:hypothetical protein